MPVYRASDGYPLFYRHWRPTGPARATIVALHGIQSHGGWYSYSSTCLARAGYEVYFLDRRGSGLNKRQRGHALHEERLLADVQQFLRKLEWDNRDADPRPVVLLGVSWGGKLAATFAAEHPADIDALALLYPGLHSKVQPNWWQKLRLEWASAAGWGEITAPIPLNEPALFTDSPRWREFIRRDELSLQRVTVDFLRANIRLTEALAGRVTRITAPVLMMLAGRDQVIDNVGNRAAFQRMPNSRNLLIDYPLACHTLEFEPDPDEFLADLLSWLETTVAAPARTAETPVPATLRIARDRFPAA